MNDLTNYISTSFNSYHWSTIINYWSRRRNITATTNSEQYIDNFINLTSFFSDDERRVGSGVGTFVDGRGVGLLAGGAIGRGDGFSVARFIGRSRK